MDVQKDFVRRVRRVACRAARCRRDPRLVLFARVLSTLLVMLAGVDILSTSAALAAGAAEGNPLTSILQHDFGVFWVVPKMLIHLAFACFILWLPSRKMLRCAGLVVAAYMLVAINNFYLAGMFF